MPRHKKGEPYYRYGKGTEKQRLYGNEKEPFHPASMFLSGPVLQKLGMKAKRPQSPVQDPAVPGDERPQDPPQTTSEED